MVTCARRPWAALLACLAMAAPLAAIADPANGIDPGVRDSVSPGVGSGVSGGDCERLRAELAQTSAQDQTAGASVGAAVETLAAAQTQQPGSAAVSLARDNLLAQQQQRADTVQALERAQQRLAGAHCS